MATIAPAVGFVTTGSKVPKVLWETLTAANAVGDGFLLAAANGHYANVQAVGTFDSATVVMQGSNDGTNWASLDDFLGVAVSLTAAGALDFPASMAYIRVSTSGGGGSQDLDVTVVLRG